MIFHPREGQTVRIHYAAKAARHMPFHGRVGKVMWTPPPLQGPRNVCVQLDDDTIICGPRGNLVAIDAQDLQSPWPKRERFTTEDTESTEKREAAL